MSWRDVRLGAALVALLAAALFGVWIQRGRNPFVEAYSLVLFVEDARGLDEGAPVLLSGVRIGEVREIGVLSGSDPVRRQYPDRLKGLHIRVVLSVSQEYRDEITDRSLARIATTGVSGARHVHIDKGPVGGRPLASGERLQVAPAVDLEFVLERGRLILDDVARINRTSRELDAKLESGAGTLGRLIADPADNEVAENLELMNRRAERVLRNLDEGEGTIGLERRRRGVRENLARFQESLERIQRRAEGGSLKRLASDRQLGEAVARVEAKLARLEARLQQGDGSLGRFLNDPELFDQIQLLTLALDSLATRVMEDPLGSVDVDLH